MPWLHLIYNSTISTIYNLQTSASWTTSETLIEMAHGPFGACLYVGLAILIKSWNFNRERGQTRAKRRLIMK